MAIKYKRKTNEYMCVIKQTCFWNTVHFSNLDLFYTKYCTSYWISTDKLLLQQTLRNVQSL
jgi:hypothetical protein